MLRCNVLSSFSELCENPIGGRSWIFTSVGLKVFHVKIVCSLFADIYFLLCQEHPVRIGIPAFCEYLAILDKA